MARHLRDSFVTLAAIWIFSVCIATHAEAQSTADKAAAEALFDRGLALLKEGKYQEACQTLEQSQAVERGIGTMLYLAECYEKIGRSASAWALFREAASSAQAAGQAERAEAGRRRAEKLEKGLARLTIQVPAASRAPGLVIQDNGSALQQAVWGVALPVDPGVHRVQASAPGYTPWSGETKVEDHAANADISVPALVKDPNAVAVASGPTSTDQSASGGSATSARAGVSASERQRMSTLRIIGIALGGAGVLGVGVGAIMGGLSMGNKNDVKDAQRPNGGYCPNAACNDALKDAKSQANASTALFAVGGALLVGGVVTFLLAPKYQETKPAVALYADPKGAALSLRGVF